MNFGTTSDPWCTPPPTYKNSYPRRRKSSKQVNSELLQFLELQSPSKKSLRRRHDLIFTTGPRSKSVSYPDTSKIPGSMPYGNANESRLPDIQMINKYYGLVPKKFTVHSRQGVEQIGSSRAKSAFLRGYPTKNSSLDEPSGSDNELDKESSVWGRNGHRKRSNHAQNKPNSGTDLQVLSRKCSVDRPNKLLRHRGRSSSLPLSSSEPLPTSGSGYQTRESHRVIKIDLNNMSWEEGPGTGSLEDEENNNSPRCSESSSLSLDKDDCNGNPGSLELGNGNSQHFQSNDGCPLETGVKAGSTSPEIDGESQQILIPSTNTSIEEQSREEGNQNGLLSPVVFSVSGSEPDRESLAPARRGRLKKTISFDEGILRNSSENGCNPVNPEKSDMTKSRRPSTAQSRALPSLPPPPTPTQNKGPKPKILPWTQTKGLSLSERRSKLVKSVSIHSTDSLEFLEECSDTETLSNWTPRVTPGVTPPCLPAPGSSAYKEIRKSLYFQPEVENLATLISCQTPPQEAPDFEVDMAQVALILNSISTPNAFIDLSPHETEPYPRPDGVKSRISSNPPAPPQFERVDAIQSLNSQTFARFLPLGTQLPEKISLRPSPSEKNINQNDVKKQSVPKTESLTSLTGSNAIKTASVTRNNSVGGSSNPSPDSRVSHSHGSRPMLRKAVSISCEKELFPPSGAGNEVNPRHNWNNRTRPKTSTPKPLLRTLSTPSITPKSVAKSVIVSKNNKSQDQSQCQPANQNPGQRSHLLKKALMEINQSAAAIRSKWGPSRPKTAPQPNPKAVRRLPLKTSPALVTIGDKSRVPGITQLTPTSTMGKKPVQTPSVQEPDVPPIEDPADPPRRPLPRQSFSLDEGMLLTFSGKSDLGWKSREDQELPWNGSLAKLEESRRQNCLQSSKKREQCLRIYEKMAKTGTSVKLDTILRGMMTPSEYRVFIKAAENAAKELAATREEDGQNVADAGVSGDSVESPNKEVTLAE